VRQQKFKALVWSGGLTSLAFIVVILLGHLYCAMLVLALTFVSFKEVISLKRRDDKDSKILFSWIDKYYFGTFCFIVLPQFLLSSKKLQQSIESEPLLFGLLIEYHKLICFFLFIFGILFFVLSLEKSSLRYSFMRLTWTLVTLLVIFMTPVPFFYNIYKGLFWFILPQVIVAINDMS
jgi:phosphatidate cytidylyltransferase